MQSTDYPDAAAIRVPLLQRNGAIRDYALISPQDADLVRSYRWSQSHGYACRSRARRTEWMHRLIVGLTRGDRLEADHINRQRLDNRRCNLRIVTHMKNAQNLPARGASGVRGVSLGANGWWNVRFTVDGKFNWVGGFRTFSEAADASYAWLREYLPHALDGDLIPFPIIVGTLNPSRDRKLDNPGPDHILPFDVAVEIRHRRLAGERGRDLADEFGISQQLVCDIKMGRRYRASLEDQPRVSADEAIRAAREQINDRRMTG